MQENLICGINAVLAALEHNPARVEMVWVSADRSDRRTTAVLSAAEQGGVQMQRVGRMTLDKLAAGTPHQGVIARILPGGAQNERDLPALLATLTTPLLLVLDGVQDPHNLGACLRAACAAGAHAVLTPRDRAAPITPAVRRAAAGATELIPVFRVSNLARTLRILKENDIWLVGASPDGSVDVFGADLRGALALVLGGEGKGLRRLTREHCDLLVRIPMASSVDSLNVAVAAGVCLFEAVRQRRPAER